MESSGEFRTEIRCKCGSNILLTTNNDKAIISNWTRHVLKNCLHLKKKGKGEKQIKMSAYFNHPLVKNGNSGMTNSQVSEMETLVDTIPTQYKEASIDLTSSRTQTNQDFLQAPFIVPTE